MTPITPQFEVFWALLLSSEHSGVPEDSKSSTFPSVGLHPHTWPKWGCNKIGRVYYAHPVSGEKYYLQMLLNVVCGATSFEDLRTVDGHVCATFKEACQARGLLENDQEWAHALEEASHWAMGRWLHDLFASVLLFNEVINLGELWHYFADDLSDDLQASVRRESGDRDLTLTME
jgi:hypothetical protein